MITSTIEQAGYRLVSKVSEDHVSVKPIGESIFTPSYLATNITLSRNIKPVEEEDSIIVVNSNVISDGVNYHDVLVSEAAVKVAAGIRNQTDLCVNTLIPLISDCVTKAKENAESFSCREIPNVQVKQLETSPIFKSDVLLNIIDQYENYPMAAKESVQFREGAFPDEVPTSVLLAAFVTGIKELDDISAECVTTDTVTHAYRSMANHYCAFDMDSTAMVFAGYMLSRHFATTILEGCNIGGNVYTAVFNAYTAIFGRRLCYLQEREKSLLTTKVVIKTIKFSEWNNCTDVVVNGPAYREYLKDGGNVDAIIGQATTGAGNVTGAYLLDNQVQLISIAKTYRAKRELMVTAKQNGLMNGVIFNVVNDLINAEEDPYTLYANENRAPFHTTLNKYVELTPWNSQMDLTIYMRGLLTNVFFPNTNLCDILVTMDKHAAAHPDIDIREVALWTNIHITARWAAAQLEVRGVQLED